MVSKVKVQLKRTPPSTGTATEIGGGVEKWLENLTELYDRNYSQLLRFNEYGRDKKNQENYALEKSGNLEKIVNLLQEQRDLIKHESVERENREAREVSTRIKKIEKQESTSGLQKALKDFTDSLSSRFENFGKGFNNKNPVGRIIDAIGSSLGLANGPISKGLLGGIKGVIQLPKFIFKSVADIGLGVIKGIVSAVGKVLGKNALTKLAEGSLSRLAVGTIPIVGWILDIASLFSFIWEYIRNSLIEATKSMPIANYAVLWLDNIITPINNFFNHLFDAVVDIFTGNTQKLKSDLKDALKDVYTSVKGIFTPLTETLLAAKDIVVGLSSGFTSAWDKFKKGDAVGAWKALKQNFNKSLQVAAGEYTLTEATSYDQMKVGEAQNALAFIRRNEQGPGGYGSYNRKVGANEKGFAFGAYQFSDPSVQRDIISQLAGNSDIQKQFPEFTDKMRQRTFDVNNLSPSDAKVFAQILNTPAGRQIQDDYVRKHYLKEGLDIASKITVGGKNLYDLAMEDKSGKIAGLIADKQLRGDLKYDSGKSFGSLREWAASGTANLSNQRRQSRLSYLSGGSTSNLLDALQFGLTDTTSTSLKPTNVGHINTQLNTTSGVTVSNTSTDSAVQSTPSSNNNLALGPDLLPYSVDLVARTMGVKT